MLVMMIVSQMVSNLLSSNVKSGKGCFLLQFRAAMAVVLIKLTTCFDDLAREDAPESMDRTKMFATEWLCTIMVSYVSTGL